MKRNGNETGRQREVLRKLKKLYPAAECALHFRNAYELLVATILSAQSTDKTVNEVTPALFAKYPSPRDLAQADRAELESLVHATGFFRNKARNLQACAQVLVTRYNSEVPQTMAELLELPGVGRKTANVVLGNAFGKNEGIVVDTHVRRLAQRLGFTGHTQPEKIEQDLTAWVPQNDWTIFSHLLILHGRQVCAARKPRCATCIISPECPASLV